MICRARTKNAPLLRPAETGSLVVHGEISRASLRLRTFVLASLCAATVGGLTASAEEHAFTVAQPLTASGELSAAYVLAVQGERVLSLAPALTLPGAQPGEVLVAGRLSADKIGADPVTVLATVEMKDGAVASSVQSLSRDTAFLDANALRARAAALRAAQGQSQRSASEKLAQVNAEAGELLKLERAIGSEDLPADPEGHRRRLVELRQLVKQRMEAIKSQPPPPAFKKRESELSAQLNALTIALRAEEARRREGGGAVSPELQAKLDLIKSTKNEHIDLLRKELLELRKEREP